MDDAFGNWLAGFIDGEGCFDIHRRNAYRGKAEYFYCRFALNVRADERPTIEDIIWQTGLGKLHERPYSKHPQVSWSITSREHLLALDLILCEFPLRAKKRDDWRIWRQALIYCATRKRNSGWETMAIYKQKLETQRKYREASIDVELRSVMSS